MPSDLSILYSFIHFIHETWVYNMNITTLFPCSTSNIIAIFVWNLWLEWMIMKYSWRIWTVLTDGLDVVPIVIWSLFDVRHKWMLRSKYTSLHIFPTIIRYCDNWRTFTLRIKKNFDISVQIFTIREKKYTTWRWTISLSYSQDTFIHCFIKHFAVVDRCCRYWMEKCRLLLRSIAINSTLQPILFFFFFIVWQLFW